MDIFRFLLILILALIFLIFIVSCVANTAIYLRSDKTLSQKIIALMINALVVLLVADFVLELGRFLGL